MPHPSLRLAAMALLLPLCACDGGFSGTPQTFTCVADATATATVDGQPFASTCVEVDAQAGLFVDAFENQAVQNGVKRELKVRLPRRAVGTYAVADGASVEFATSTIVNGGFTTSRIGDATAVQVAVTEVTATQARGTFSGTLAEKAYQPNGEYVLTGRTIEVTGGAFSVTF